MKSYPVALDERSQYYRLAAQAIEAGILTEKEKDLICHAGTRKMPYFGRHLRDLCAVIEDRLDKVTDVKQRQVIRKYIKEAGYGLLQAA